MEKLLELKASSTSSNNETQSSCQDHRMQNGVKEGRRGQGVAERRAIPPPPPLASPGHGLGRPEGTPSELGLLRTI